MRVFTIHFTDEGQFEVKADYCAPFLAGIAIGFYVKPHWWSRARCVGVAEWRFVAAVESREEETDKDFLVKAGINA
jgi:hypothetical protein